MKAIILKTCPKSANVLDKAKQPEETLEYARKMLKSSGLNILAKTSRIDNGRLGIPVYLSVCGKDASAIMPVRKQMGKGATIAQAEASALMELMERYSFFSFWQKNDDMVKASWSEAEQKFGGSLISVSEILASVNENLDNEAAKEILNTVKWSFYPATRLKDGKLIWLPLDWFRLLNEFNGSSAGNTNEESLLQGLCELVERHVSAIVSKKQPVLPTIDPASCSGILEDLLSAFKKEGIKIILKDMSLDMPLPTVAALAYDPSTFPHKSEIVFTAGAASSPEKAAIRAVTEVAQLGGDFNSCSCYEASGLPKFLNITDCEWLLTGGITRLDSLPSLNDSDIYKELMACVHALEPLKTYAIETTHPAIQIPAHYCIVPGLQFRERDSSQTLGLFAGRMLIEKSSLADAEKGLQILKKHYPNAHFLPFFKGMLALKKKDFANAAELFKKASLKQPDADSKALVSFYAGHALAQAENWQNALAWLKDSLRLSPMLKESANLLGVAFYKLQNYAEAEKWFDYALKIDKGSAHDLANRGVCRKMQGKNQDAMKDLANALELDSTLDYAKKHLAELKAL